MASSAPPLPPVLKSLQHYLKTAVEHDARDIVVAYYCRLYSVQKGMRIDSKSPDARAWLMGMMDVLENIKKTHPNEEAIQNEVVGQAHMEEYALKVFLYADNEDRAGRFGKNVVKSFYSAAMLLDVCTNFGELTEDMENNRKYARWKAAYIHNCLKNGETPVAGPVGGDEPQPGATGGLGFDGMNQPSVPSISQPGPSQPAGGVGGPQAPGGYPAAPGGHSPSGGYPNPNYGTHAPPTTPNDPPAAAMPPAAAPQRYQPASSTGAANLKAEDYQKAMKFCKFANSALQYEDAKTAIENLTKALNLLTTGRE